jgi:YfiR/HmsC-like
LPTRRGGRISDHRHSVLRRREVWSLLCVIAACTLWPASGNAAPDEKPSQYDVEAAYLFNFGKFVTWPGDAPASDRPLTICVLGNDPFGPTLDRLVAGEKIGGKAVVDKRISRVEDAPNCSILYISSSETAHLNRILGLVKEAPVLTVSDIPDFAHRGGIIQFVVRDNRVRFTVNLAPAQRDRLTLSSELLKVAVDVKRPEDSH